MERVSSLDISSLFDLASDFFHDACMYDITINGSYRFFWNDANLIHQDDQFFSNIAVFKLIKLSAVNYEDLQINIQLPNTDKLV